MSIIACPRCRDEVTLPPKVSPQARVRCPLCRDEYILSEALAAMPPALIVLDAGPEVETRGYAEPEYRVAGEAGVATPGGVFDTTGPTGEAVTTAPRPLKGAAKPRRKKEGSAVGMIVQVVFGGVAAIVIFQALAWWVMDKDPFELGPVVSQYVPAIVPKRWHGKTNGSNEKPATNDNNAVASVPVNNQKPKPNNTGSGNSFDAGPQFNNLDPGTVNPLDPGAAPKVGPEPGDLKIDDPLAVPVKPMPEKPMPEKPVDFTPPMPKPLDPNAKPKFSSAQIQIPHAKAVAKSAAFDEAAEAEPAVKKQAGKEMFESAAELGKIIAQADLADPELEDVASQVKEYSILLSGKMRFVNFFAAERISAKEGDDGIVLGGKIADVKSAGDFFETTVEISPSLAVQVVSAKNPLDDGAKIGDTAVVLGRIVRDPKKDLPKYAGEGAQVIQAGQTTIVPQN